MKLTMSIEGECLPERQLQKLGRLPKKLGRVLVDVSRPSLRYFSSVEVGRNRYWVDRVTGTLYRPDDGRCLSSNRMRLDLSTLE